MSISLWINFSSYTGLGMNFHPLLNVYNQLKASVEIKKKSKTSFFLLTRIKQDFLFRFKMSAVCLLWSLYLCFLLRRTLTTLINSRLHLVSAGLSVTDCSPRLSESVCPQLWITCVQHTQPAHLSPTRREQSGKDNLWNVALLSKVSRVEGSPSSSFIGS